MTIIKKFEPEEKRIVNYKKKFPKKYLFLAIITLLTLTLVEIWVTNIAVAYGGKFEKLTEAEKNLIMENQILENQIAKNASLANIASKSAQLGFSSAAKIQYIR